MRYCGSKRRYASEIVPILIGAVKNEETTFIDMCCGGCSIVSEMPVTNKIAVDSNRYVISLWNKLKENVMNGFPYDGIPFDITEEQYLSVKKSYEENDGRVPDWYIGYVGNALSYGSSWFNGFAKPNMKKRDKYGRPENHCNEAYNGLMKQLGGFKHMNTTEFVCKSFLDVTPSENTVIYCDPPYANTKKYMTDFPHAEFYDWCRECSKIKDVKIFVSEYNMPSDFKCVWSKKKKDCMSNKNGSTTYVEKLFTLPSIC